MILNRQRKVRVALPPLERFLRRARKEAGAASSEVTVCLVTDAEMARMNQAFRRKHGPTDVLSFPAGKEEGDSCGAEKAFLGDIAIAPETARRHARRNGRSLASELRVLILHGVLHLLGYDHESDNGEMDRFEKRLRGRLGLK